MTEDRPKRRCARYVVRAYSEEWKELHTDQEPVTAHTMLAAIELWNVQHQRIARSGVTMLDAAEPAAFVELEVRYVEV